MTQNTTAADSLSTTATAATPATPLRVAVIIASNRKGRFGPVVADWLLARIGEHRTSRSTSSTWPRPLCRPRSPSARLPDARPARRGRPALAAADAFIIITPEYNHSYPASLKVLIDWHFDEWQAKPVAFVSYGGISGGLRAVEHLRQVFAELHAVADPRHRLLPQRRRPLRRPGRAQDPSRRRRRQDDAHQLAWWGLGPAGRQGGPSVRQLRSMRGGRQAPGRCTAATAPPSSALSELHPGADHLGLAECDGQAEARALAALARSGLEPLRAVRQQPLREAGPVVAHPDLHAVDPHLDRSTAVPMGVADQVGEDPLQTARVGPYGVQSRIASLLPLTHRREAGRRTGPPYAPRWSSVPAGAPPGPASPPPRRAAPLRADPR